VESRLFLIRLPKGRNVIMLQNIDNGYPFQECIQCGHVEVCRHVYSLMSLKSEGLLPIDLNMADCEGYLDISRISLKESASKTGCTGCDREVAEVSGIEGATRISCGCVGCGGTIPTDEESNTQGIPTDGEDIDTVFGAFLKSLYLGGVDRLEQKLNESSDAMTEPKPCNLGSITANKLNIASELDKDVKTEDAKRDKPNTIDRASVNNLISSLIKDILGDPSSSSPIAGAVAYCGSMYETLVATCKDYVAKGFKPVMMKLSSDSLERLCKEAGLPKYKGSVLSQMAVCQGVSLQVVIDDNMELGMFAIGIKG
jgi:hypothetical protein